MLKYSEDLAQFCSRKELLKAFDQIHPQPAAFSSMITTILSTTVLTYDAGVSMLTQTANPEEWSYNSAIIMPAQCARHSPPHTDLSCLHTLDLLTTLTHSAYTHLLSPDTLPGRSDCTPVCGIWTAVTAWEGWVSGRAAVAPGPLLPFPRPGPSLTAAS